MAFRKIEAQFDGTCAYCDGATDEGEPLYWDPDTKDAMHPGCFDAHCVGPGGGLEVEDLAPIPGSLADGIAQELGAESTAVADLGDALNGVRAARVEDRFKVLGARLASDAARAVNGTEPVDVLEWRRRLERAGVPCIIRAAPIPSSSEEDIDDIAGWSEARAEELWMEARELITNMGTGPTVDRLQDVVQDLAARAKAEEVE